MLAYLLIHPQATLYQVNQNPMITFDSNEMDVYELKSLKLEYFKYVQLKMINLTIDQFTSKNEQLKTFIL